METGHALVAHWAGRFNEEGFQAWVEGVRRKWTAPQVTLGIVFMTPELFPDADQALEILRVHGRIPLLVGCSSRSLIFDDQEAEEEVGLVFGLYFLPGADLRACAFNQSMVDHAGGPEFWYDRTGIRPEQSNGWLVFADPFHIDAEAWIQQWNQAYAPRPIVGGLSWGGPSEAYTQVYHNGEVLEEGGVAVNFGGDVELASVVSQGCTPIGDTWTITKVDRNFIHEIGNRPAYEVLADTFNNLSAREQKLARGNLFIGLVVNEYREEFHRGDFLVRNLIGADTRSGSLAVLAMPRLGQTVQFQRRDAQAAREDLSLSLEKVKEGLAGREIYGGCLCCCNGRGHRLFGQKNHDAATLQRELGPVGVAGFFCNGEIGPVGERNYLHGYTASLALFVKKNPPEAP